MTKPKDRPSTGARWRWTLATHLNRLPSSCWAHLVTWALNWDTPLREAVTSGGQCRVEAATCAHGCCYCGKFRGEKSETP